MPRDYARRLDHDEACRLRSVGVPLREIAERYGVSVPAVYNATTPGEKQRRLEYKRRWGRTTCGDCGAPAQRINFSGPHPRCHQCATRLRAASVRQGELQCCRCRAWKPDGDFPRKRTNVMRRGRRHFCRVCETVMKREYRERRKALSPPRRAES